MVMRYLSVCSGIEAATVAWHDMGWSPVAFSEIETFPSAVLRTHYPDVPNWGDMTKFQEWPNAAIDLLVGGTPCQSFSTAGLRAGLADPRGNLALTYLAIVNRYRPRWVVWENVPGVLSSAGGRDFGAFLGGLGELGYGWAYRVLDAQYFGVAQRRRRVFVVGCLGSWQRAAAVLFERHSLSGHPAPRREAGEDAPDRASTRAAISSGRGYWNESEVGATLRSQDSVNKADTLIPQISLCLNAGGMQRKDLETETFIPVVTPAHAFDARQSHVVQYGDLTGPLDTYGQSVGVMQPVAIQGMAVRRLTPRECERLQGFPDDYTLISYRNKPAADGPRYKALGNSMAVPVMRWIGQRIQEVDRVER